MRRVCVFVAVAALVAPIAAAPMELGLTPDALAVVAPYLGASIHPSVVLLLAALIGVILLRSSQRKSSAIGAGGPEYVGPPVVVSDATRDEEPV
jgi:hypothetical protein